MRSCVLHVYAHMRRDVMYNVFLICSFLTGMLCQLILVGSLVVSVKDTLLVKLSECVI